MAATAATTTTTAQTNKVPYESGLKNALRRVLIHIVNYIISLWESYGNKCKNEINAEIAAKATFINVLDDEAGTNLGYIMGEAWSGTGTKPQDDHVVTYQWEDGKPKMVNGLPVIASDNWTDGDTITLPVYGVQITYKQAACYQSIGIKEAQA